MLPWSHRSSRILPAGKSKNADGRQCACSEEPRFLSGAGVNQKARFA
jgi:hypothetical protein